MKAYCPSIRKRDLVSASLASILATASLVLAVILAAAKKWTFKSFHSIDARMR